MNGARIRVDGREVEVPAGGTLRDAAAALGVALPTLCHREGEEASASCLACLVRERGSGRLLPACAVRPVTGMEIETDGPEVRAAWEQVMMVGIRYMCTPYNRWRGGPFSREDRP